MNVIPLQASNSASASRGGQPPAGVPNSSAIGAKNAPGSSATVTLTLTLTERLARTLPRNTHANFYAEQPHRFQLLDEPDLPLPNDPVFTGGTMTFFSGAVTDMVLFRAYEEQCGHAVRPLYDLAGEEGFVLLSSRPNPFGIDV